MLVHPAALRPIPLPLSAIGVGVGVLFLVLVMGLSRTDTALTVDPSLFQLVSAVNFPSTESDAQIVSVRSNTVLVELSLVPTPATVGDRGAIFFQRLDGAIFPIVREAWVERPNGNRSVLFVSSADGLLLSRVAGNGRFLWKIFDGEFAPPKRLERRTSVLLQAGAGRFLPINTGETPAIPGEQAANLESRGEPETTPIRESVVWFPGDTNSYVIMPDGGIQRVLPSGLREKVGD